MSTVELEYYRMGHTPVYTAGFDIVESNGGNTEYEKVLAEISKEGALDVVKDEPVKGGDEIDDKILEILQKVKTADVSSPTSPVVASPTGESIDNEIDIDNVDISAKKDDVGMDDLIEEINGGADIDFDKYLRDE